MLYRTCCSVSWHWLFILVSYLNDWFLFCGQLVNLWELWLNEFESLFMCFWCHVCQIRWKVSFSRKHRHNVLLLTYIWPVQRICKSLFTRKRDQIRNVICTRNKNGIQVTHSLSTEKHKNWHLEKSTVNTAWTRIKSVCTMLAINLLFHLLLLKNLTFKRWKELSIFLRDFVILLLTFTNHENVRNSLNSFRKILWND